MKKMRKINKLPLVLGVMLFSLTGYVEAANGYSQPSGGRGAPSANAQPRSNSGQGQQGQGGDLYAKYCADPIQQAYKAENDAIKNFLNLDQTFNEMVSNSSQAFGGVQGCIQNAMAGGLTMGITNVPGLSQLTTGIMNNVSNMAIRACNDVVNTAKAKANETLSKYSVNAGDLLNKRFGNGGGIFGDEFRKYIGSAGINPSLK